MRCPPLPVLHQKRPDGELFGVIGASRSGKTEWTRQRVQCAARLLLWDYKGEWKRYDCQRVEDLEDLAELVRPDAPPQRLALHMAGMSDRRVFALFCRLAFVWLRADIGTLVIEETSSVTRPNWAPNAYADILRMGLGFGCDIYALTQRPQESDKTAYGNATVLHCHQLGTPADCRYVARNWLPVSIDELIALERLQWVERRNNTGELCRGVVQLPRKRTR